MVSFARSLIDAQIELFDKVYIDNVLVDKSNYFVTSGSTILTFNYDYTKTLSNGNHTLRAIFTDNSYSTTDFTIQIDNPKTYDNSTLYIVLGLVGIITISLSCTMLLKKQK